MLGNAVEVKYGMYLTLIPTVTRLIRENFAVGVPRKIADNECLLVAVTFPDGQKNGYQIHIVPANTRNMLYSIDDVALAGILARKPELKGLSSCLATVNVKNSKVSWFYANAEHERRSPYVLMWAVNAGFALLREPILRIGNLYSDAGVIHEFLVDSHKYNVDLASAISYNMPLDDLFKEIADSYTRSILADVTEGHSSGWSKLPKDFQFNFLDIRKRRKTDTIDYNKPLGVKDIASFSMVPDENPREACALDPSMDYINPDVYYGGDDIVKVFLNQ